MPRHVGIILDGNRRHGRKRQLRDPRMIYGLGAQKLDEMLEWCSQLQIPALTAWALSTDNLARPKDELAAILSAIERKIAAWLRDPQIHRRRVRIRAVGRLELLPPRLLEIIQEAERATTPHSDLVLTIAIAYGGRDEISEAVRAFLRAKAVEGCTLEEVVDQITPESIGRHLYSVDLPEPDLIVRTSGEIRLSGFLLWQSTFSELYFSDVDWPAFRRIDFLRAIRSFQQRARRFGR